MDPRVFHQAARQAERFQTFTRNGATFVRRSRSPLETLLFAVVALLFLALFLVLVIPFVVLAVAIALGAAAYVGVRRMISRSRSPNGHIGPVRTDGRENVRVIDRDSR